jgi:hypothetical protein
MNGLEIVNEKIAKAISERNQKIISMQDDILNMSELNDSKLCQHLGDAIAILGNEIVGLGIAQAFVQHQMTMEGV